MQTITTIGLDIAKSVFRVTLGNESHPAVNANKLVKSGRLGTFRTWPDTRLESFAEAIRRQKAFKSYCG